MLTNIFPLTNISDNGRYVQASAILQLYNALYDKIVEGAAPNRAELQKLQKEIGDIQS
jgi:hypothetical protein